MDFERLRQFLIAGNAEEVGRGVHALLTAGVSGGEILNNALLPGMTEVGHLFEAGEYFIPDMMIAARAMHRAMDILEPVLVDAGAGAGAPKVQVVLGTVHGDLHELGKNLVGMMLKGAGFDVHDLGVDVPVEAFVAAAAEGADILGMSALLSTTMTNMSLVIEALVQAGVRKKVRVIVGGSPITQEFADKIGADGYAPDAVQAVRCVKQLMHIE